MNGRGDTRPVILFQVTGTDGALIDAPQRGEHPHDDGFRRHLHGEHQHWLVALDRHVFAQIHGEGGLTHGGTAGDHDHVGGLQATGHFIQLFKTGGQAGERALGFVQLINAVHRLFQHRLDVLGAIAFLLLLGNLEDGGLGLIENFQGFTPFGIKRAIRHLVRHIDQLPQDAALTDDIRIGGNVGRTGGISGQLRQIGHTADGFELPQVIERLGDGDQVTGVFLFHQLGNHVENQAVLLAVEIPRAHSLGHIIPGAVIE